MGRRKIEMEMVQDKNCRQVTFSKRRAGLFKKAQELATLCAVQIAITVFSPGGKPFSFGSPDFDTVADKFLSQHGENSARVDADNIGNASNSNHSGSATKKLNRKLDRLQRAIELEKKNRSGFKEKMKNDGVSLGGLKAVKKMKMEDLVDLKNRLESFHGDVRGRAKEIQAMLSLYQMSKDAYKATEENSESESSGSDDMSD